VFQLFYIALLIIPLSLLIGLSTHPILARPSVSINPTCGPEPGFNILISASGFSPNSKIGWKLVGSDNTIPANGYFVTDNTGSFTGFRTADNLKNDHYKIYVAGLDEKFDIGTAPAVGDLSVPCGGPSNRILSVQENFVPKESSKNVSVTRIMSGNATAYTGDEIYNCRSQVSNKFFVNGETGEVVDQNNRVVDFCSNILHSGSIVPNATIGLEYTQYYYNYSPKANLTGITIAPLNEDVRRDCANALRDNYYVDPDGKIYGENMMPLNKDCTDVFNGNVDAGILRVTQNESYQVPIEQSQPVQQSPPSTQNWVPTCEKLEWGLMNKCDVYVNPDGSLTAEGQRARQCISNGGLLSAAGIIMNLPPNIIIGILQPLSESTNCGNIVNWAILKTATNPMEFLSQLKK